MKEEALELADFLEKNMVASVAILGDVTATHIVSTIRKLVEELDRLVGAEPITHGKLTFCKNCGQQDPYTQTKPLSYEEIQQIYMDIFKWEIKNPKDNWVLLVREIERRLTDGKKI